MIIDVEDVDIKKLLEEEKRARMDSDGIKSSALCVNIVS